MIEIIKEKSETKTYDIRLIINEDVHMDILYGGTGDIYWIYDNLKMINVPIKEDPMNETFQITKKDQDIYHIFNELYEDLINCQIYYPDKCNFLPGYNEQEEKRCFELNQSIKQSPRYNKLVKDGIITWYSDEEYHSNAEIVQISKKDEIINIKFIRQSKRDDLGQLRMPGYYSIRFRMSGSTYEPCGIVFWRHFDNFQKYNIESISTKPNSSQTKKLTKSK